MIKRLLIGFLLLVFLYNSGGYYLCFRYYQESIRREVKMSIRNGLPKTELTDIVAHDDISWVKPGKEFKYKGGLYDVVKTSFKNGIKHFYCINDSKEKKLLTELQKLKTRKFEKRVKTVVNFFAVPEEFVVLQNVKSVLYGLFINNYKSSYCEVLSPPPPFS